MERSQHDSVFQWKNMEVPCPFRNLFLCGSNSKTFRSSIFKFGPAIPMFQYRFEIGLNQVGVHEEIAPSFMVKIW